jgi:hypothetical protein
VLVELGLRATYYLAIEALEWDWYAGGWLARSPDSLTAC